jgi:hypothetical protein
MKAGRASYHSIRHSDQNSETHKRDVAQAKKKRNQRKAIIVEPLEENGVFGSDLSLLGQGRKFGLGNKDGKRVLVALNSLDWEEQLARSKNNLSWYHQARKNTKSGYTVRKVRDRTKLGEKDKRARADSDLQRETIDLRPDHSRAVQYFLQSGHTEAVRGMVARIREKKIRLFEKIYPGRRVLFVSEHDDSGQLHHDLWHSGIREHSTKLHKGKKVRERVAFRRFGVGVGVTSWYRHFTALSQRGGTAKSAATTMGAAYDVLKRNIASAREQNGEEARDILLTKKLDEYVQEQLDTLASELTGKSREIPRQAHDEYKTWLVRDGLESRLLRAQAQAKRQMEEIKVLVEEKQKLLADNARLGRVVELATKVIISIVESSLWKALEKLCTQTASRLRALAAALGIATDKAKKTSQGPNQSAPGSRLGSV